MSGLQGLRASDHRFKRYRGDKLHHIAVNVVSYMLIKSRIHLLLSSKLALIFNSTIWDDATGVNLKTKLYQIVVTESLKAKNLMGLSLTMIWRGLFENLSRMPCCQLSFG